MSRILSTERSLYEDIWSSVPTYADFAPGESYLPIFLEMVGAGQGRTVLDVGTGSGKGALALQQAGFLVRTCDVTDAGLVLGAKLLPFQQACAWHDLSTITRDFGHAGRTKAAFVYCCDVLEHIPPQFTMLAIDQMLRVCREGLFLTVSLVPDHFGVWVGSSLHQTVESFVWWRDSLKELGTVEEARDLVGEAVFFVVPR
jgi:SAM-dependent methyltransferase